jgi:hypothetical protein
LNNRICKHPQWKIQKIQDLYTRFQSSIVEHVDERRCLMAVGTVDGRMQILEVVGNLVRRTNRINEVDHVMVRQPIHAENVVMSSRT